jgi:uncharacterized protein (DUF983 family)
MTNSSLTIGLAALVASSLVITLWLTIAIYQAIIVLRDLKRRVIALQDRVGKLQRHTR